MMKLAAVSASMQKHAVICVLLLALVPSALAVDDGSVGDQSSDFRVSEEARVYYRAITSLNAADQKVLFASLPSTLKSEIWKYKLVHLLENRQNLTEPQRNLLKDAVAFVDQDPFRTDLPGPTWIVLRAPLERLKSRAVDVFGDEAATVFTRLETPDDHDGTPTGGRRPDDDESFPRRTRLIGKPVALTCASTCSTVDSWCGSGSICTDLCFCRRSSWGCGMLFLYPCDGICFNQDLGLPLQCP